MYEVKVYVDPDNTIVALVEDVYEITSSSKDSDLISFWGWSQVSEFDAQTQTLYTFNKKVCPMYTVREIRDSLSTDDWAEKEIALAMSKSDFYNNDCYKSALKAYKCLYNDGHSGFSLGNTKHILNKLLDRAPLTSIEDTEDIWNFIGREEEYIAVGNHKSMSVAVYQCKRFGPLFKKYHNGYRVTYHDNARCIAVDMATNQDFRSDLVNTIMDELVPIEMPYTPSSKPIMVFCEDCLTDEKNGDYDTVVIHYAKFQSGDELLINRYFKDPSADDGQMVEITEEEWNDRVMLASARNRLPHQEPVPEMLTKKFNI